MKIRKFVAGTIAAGAITLGVTGVASAQTPSDRPDRGAHRQELCKFAHDHEQWMKEVQQHLNDLENRMREMRAKAEQAGKQDLVAKIDARLEHLKDIRARIADRIQRVEARINEYCNSAAANG